MLPNTKETIKETIAQYIILPEKKEKDKLDKQNAEIYDEIFEVNQPIYNSILKEANHLFLEIREIVKQFVEKHPNTMLLDLTDELKLPAMNYSVVVYCYNPYRVAVMITNAIYEKIKHPMLTCRTIVEHEEFAIDITGRTFIKVYSLAPGENSKKSSYAIKSLQNDRIMPPEWEIINLLENAVYGEEDLAVDDVEKYIKKRFDLAIERYKKHLDKIHDDNINSDKIGGKEQYYFPNTKEYLGGVTNKKTKFSMFGKSTSKNIEGSHEKSCKESSKSLADQIKLMLIYDVFKSEDYVLFGTWAHAILKTKGKPCVNSDRIQLSSRKSPAEIAKIIQDFINQKIGKYEVSIGKVFPIELPEEYRLKKVSIKVLLPSLGEVAIVEWISPLQYSAVPVIKLDWQIAAKELLQRYAFIDMFVMYNVFITNNVSKEKYLLQQRKLLSLLEDVDFENTHIVGYHTPYVEYRKFHMLDSKKFIPYKPSEGIKTV